MHHVGHGVIHYGALRPDDKSAVYNPRECVCAFKI